MGSIKNGAAGHRENTSEWTNMDWLTGKQTDGYTQDCVFSRAFSSPADRRTGFSLHLELTYTAGRQ